MRVVSFTAGARSSYGIRVDGGVFDLGVRFAGFAPDLKTYLAAVAQGFAPPAAHTADFAPGEFRLLPVIPNPSKILCVGLNYQDHRKETGRPEVPHPALFTRFADSLTAHEDVIWLPPVSTSLDYEGELAVVIGKPAYRVPVERAAEHVAGYACFNDGTLRDWQHHTHQVTPGKTFQKTGAFGPELVAEIPVAAAAGGAVETRVARFIGVDGPRWFLRGVIAGDAAVQPEAAALVEDLFRSIVVVRGSVPMPPRDLIPLRMPAAPTTGNENDYSSL